MLAVLLQAACGTLLCRQRLRPQQQFACNFIIPSSHHLPDSLLHTTTPNIRSSKDLSSHLLIGTSYFEEMKNLLIHNCIGSHIYIQNYFLCLVMRFITIIHFMLVVESPTHGEGVKAVQIRTRYDKVTILLGFLIPL